MSNRKLIYLDDAINTMRRHSHYDDFDRCVIDESVAMKALKELPPAQPGEDIKAMCGECDAWNQYKNYPQPRWIPVTERLPEERDWYLGIFKESDTGWINPIPFICDYLLGKKTKATTKEGWILKECTDREEHIDYYFNLECVAWMPLPTPWKGEENGSD